MDTQTFDDYSQRLSSTIDSLDKNRIEAALQVIGDARNNGNTVYLAGNGGSAGNAVHLANDYIFGATNEAGDAVKVSALPANSSILTCLGNDIGYENIFSHQIEVLGQRGDVLIVLSGSGNSPNIIRAIETAKRQGMNTIGILGFSGGKALTAVDIPIHAKIDDMQISEDVQLIVGHYFMQQLCTM